jgi:hypothetical protein
MNHQSSTSPRSATTNECCGGASVKDKRLTEAAEATLTVDSSSAVHPVTAKPTGSCCGGSADAQPILKGSKPALSVPVP